MKQLSLLIDLNRCIGCRICVARCPGLAIFVVDQSREEGDFVSLPYEFLPLPREGDVVEALGRQGQAEGRAEVARVDPPRGESGTAVVTLKVERGKGMRVRFFRREGGVDDGA